jgi:hypothetical protein
MVKRQLALREASSLTSRQAENPGATFRRVPSQHAMRSQHQRAATVRLPFIAQPPKTLRQMGVPRAAQLPVGSRFPAVI